MNKKIDKIEEFMRGYYDFSLEKILNNIWHIPLNYYSYSDLYDLLSNFSDYLTKSMIEDYENYE